MSDSPSQLPPQPPTLLASRCLMPTKPVPPLAYLTPQSLEDPHAGDCVVGREDADKENARPRPSPSNMASTRRALADVDHWVHKLPQGLALFTGESKHEPTWVYGTGGGVSKAEGGWRELVRRAGRGGAHSGDERQAAVQWIGSVWSLPSLAPPTSPQPTRPPKSHHQHTAVDTPQTANVVWMSAGSRLVVQPP